MALNPDEYSKITESGIIRLLLLLLPSKDLEAELSLVHRGKILIILHYHTFGDASQKGSVLIDAKSLEITSSLELALRHIRDECRVVRIRADGVSINQTDVHDRNTQVAVMSSIYTSARHTIIFLGPADSKLDLTRRDIAALNTPKESIQVSLPDEILAYP